MPNTYRLNSHGMFDRRQDRNMRRVIFLSVEGTKTEVEYFGYINKYKTSLGVESVVEIHVLKRDDTKSSPEQVLDLLDEYMSLRTTSMKLEKVVASSSVNWFCGTMCSIFIYCSLFSGSRQILRIQYAHMYP